MNRQLLLIYILFYLQDSQADKENKTNDIQSKVFAFSQENQNPTKVNSSSVPTINGKNNCLDKFRTAFEFKNFSKSSKNREDLIRCQLINDSAQDFCSRSSELDLKSYTKSIYKLCEQDFEITDRIFPTFIALFLDSWKNVEHFNCKHICFENLDEHYIGICTFIFQYYTSQRNTNDEKLTELKIQSEGIQGTQTKVNLNRNNTAARESEEKVSDDIEHGNNPSDNLNDHAVDKNSGMQPNELEKKYPNVSDNIGSNQNDGIETVDKVESPNAPEENSVKLEPVMPDNEDFKNEELLHGDDSPSSLTDNIQYMAAKIDNEDSHAFLYFALISGICIIFYLMMYNKKKILALMIEGRRRNVKRRPNSAAYSKLDCNLEEAMASVPSSSVSNTLLY